MAAEGRAGVVIDVVLDERNAVRRPERFEGRLQELVAGNVVSDHVTQVQALRRSVFDVPHVEIEAAAVQEEAAIAGRFLVIAIMQIDGACLRLAEKEIFHPDRPGIGAARGRLHR